MTAEIGHNGGPTFDDIVRENLDRGSLITIKEVIIEAVRDPRLERRHLRVLAEIIDCMNTQTGVAFPGRKALAEKVRQGDLRLFPDHPSPGYSEPGIAKSISELISFGYVVATKRGAEGGGRALSHYTIRKPTTDELQAFITEFIVAQRRTEKAAKWGKNRPADVTSRGNVTSDDGPGGNVTPAVSVRPSDVTPVGNVSSHDGDPAGNVTPVSNVTSDVTPVVPTVTRVRELGEREISAREGAREGETHAGHGVYINGETIRHAEFAISLPGIAMGSIASGLTATEVRDRCLAHALQWAAEMENGTRPDKVLPSKISNFLARSIMGEINQSRVAEVRVRKASEGYSTSRTPPVPGQKQETQAERLARIGREIEEGARK